MLSEFLPELSDCTGVTNQEIAESGQFSGLPTQNASDRLRGWIDRSSFSRRYTSLAKKNALLPSSPYVAEIMSSHTRGLGFIEMAY